MNCSTLFRQYVVFLAAIWAACTLTAHCEQGDLNAEPGVSSAGSPGLKDDDQTYLSLVRSAKAKSVNSLAYFQSLVDLGMHYNRAGKHLQSESVLLQALKTLDRTGLKPTKSYQPRAPKVEETADTVTATDTSTPTRYEDAMENLLSALIESETRNHHLVQAEAHCKQLIGILSRIPGKRVPGLMSTYWQYAEVLRNLHRTKEALEYQRKGDAINSSIRPL